MAEYSLRNNLELAEFDVLVGGDKTFYGRPNTIKTQRLNFGVTDSQIYGREVDERILDVFLIGADPQTDYETLELLHLTPGDKTLVWPVSHCGSSTATASGTYIIRDMNWRPEDDGYRVRLTLKATNTELRR